MNKNFLMVKLDDDPQQIDSGQKQNNETVITQKFANNNWVYKQQVFKMAARTRIELVFPG